MNRGKRDVDDEEVELRHERAYGDDGEHPATASSRLVVPVVSRAVRSIATDWSAAGMSVIGTPSLSLAGQKNQLVSPVTGLSSITLPQSVL